MQMSVGYWGLCLLAVWGTVAATARAQLSAQVPPPFAEPPADSRQGEGYALLVGSNAGGPGQAELRYAETDTQRVSDVLTSLGGYSDEHVERLLHPTPEELSAALERMRARIERLSAAGVPSRFFFYYSGHARADALNLGAAQVPLTELRERIESLPATLSIVVLDACQSGAFSRPKGALQAADFSFNSVNRLNTQGIAVIASSNERELSQESELLRSSYFTHHWLVALRGAGDRNRDGRVTLSEAYQYAYNHTLANTAQSAVGEQHATLETNLRGQDDVALTQPATASARLRVPAAFTGRLLVQALPSWSVLAELDKAPGEPVTLALPAGSYAATVRRGDQAARCSLQLQDGGELQLDPEQCALIAGSRGQPKGEGRALTREERRARRIAEQLEVERQNIGKTERLVVEIGFGVGLGRVKTRYVSRLEDFGFRVFDESLPLRASIGVGYRVLPHLVLGLDYYNLEHGDAERQQGDLDQEFSWTGHALNAYVQADVSAGRRRLLNLFVRAGMGASLAWTTFDAVPLDAGFPDQSLSIENTAGATERVVQHYVRPCGFVGGGVQLMPGRYIGFQAELRYVLARAIENELGDKHNLGGASLIFSVRARTWE